MILVCIIMGLLRELVLLGDPFYFFLVSHVYELVQTMVALEKCRAPATLITKLY